MSGLGRKFGGDVSELGIECIEFLAQDELITILPKFKMPEINLIAVQHQVNLTTSNANYDIQPPTPRRVGVVVGLGVVDVVVGLGVVDVGDVGVDLAGVGGVGRVGCRVDDVDGVDVDDVADFDGGVGRIGSGVDFDDGGHGSGQHRAV
eukprot:1379774-Amorphochlora_amoeboformis.AAC.2